MALCRLTASDKCLKMSLNLPSYADWIMTSYGPYLATVSQTALVGEAQAHKLEEDF